MNASQVIQSWSGEAREATELVLQAHGEPDELTDSMLTWNSRGPWKRIVATKTWYPHHFPMPHPDCIESFVDYRVPVGKFSEIAAYDGSVITAECDSQHRDHVGSHRWSVRIEEAPLVADRHLR